MTTKQLAFQEVRPHQTKPPNRGEKGCENQSQRFIGAGRKTTIFAATRWSLARHHQGAHQLGLGGHPYQALTLVPGR